MFRMGLRNVGKLDVTEHRGRERERIETVTLEGHQQLRQTYSWRKGRKASERLPRAGSGVGLATVKCRWTRVNLISPKIQMS